MQRLATHASDARSPVRRAKILPPDAHLAILLPPRNTSTATNVMLLAPTGQPQIQATINVWVARLAAKCVTLLTRPTAKSVALACMFIKATA